MTRHRTRLGQGVWPSSRPRYLAVFGFEALRVRHDQVLRASRARPIAEAGDGEHPGIAVLLDALLVRLRIVTILLHLTTGRLLAAPARPDVRFGH